MSDEGAGTTRAGISKPVHALAHISIILAVTALVLAITSGLGNRYMWWDLGTSFMMLRWAAYGAFATIVISALALVLIRHHGATREFRFVLAALVIGTGFSAYILDWRSTGGDVPPIHDITTDLENPPPFVDVIAARKDAPNSHEYGGAELAQQQRDGYPDLGPLMLDVGADEAFTRALGAARRLGWEIVAAAPGEGRLEATDTTFWYGYKDDIVVRIVATDGGSRVDVRSVSRVGRSDVGTNAKRIRDFLEQVAAGE